MGRFFILTLLAGLLLSACGSATPTLSSSDVQATAVAGAFTKVAMTEMAQPSPTPLPPTPLPTPTLPPPTETPTLQITIGPPPTLTPIPAATSGGCQPLTTWEAPSTKLTVSNQTKPKGVVTLSLTVITDLGECGYISARFENAASLTVPLGSYSAWAWVDGKQDFSVSGSFRLTSGSWKLVIENERMILKAGCAPNC